MSAETVTSDQFTPDLLGRRLVVTFPYAGGVKGTLERCEYRRNPTRNGDSKPFLSFVLNMGGTSMEFGPNTARAAITHFQILPEEN